MRLSIIALFMLTLLTFSFAEDMVAVNSMDGRDVLSGIFYANVKGIPVKFMPVPGGNADIFAAKAGSNHDILLIQGSLPVSSLVENALTNKNNTITLYTSTDGGSTNLDLAKKSGATSFIIVDSAYSDSAISVMPYAAKIKAYVLLANKDNIAQIKEIVSGKRIIIFGLVDQQVKTELASMNPEIIGKGEDKYEDNILIVDKMMREYSINRAIMVDGTFVEDAMIAGDQPILLSGRLVPQATYDFIKQNVRDNKLSGVMLIGNDLVVPIYDMRERMKKEFETEGLNKTFGITVKFAQVIPSAGTGVLTLDTFRMPSYKPDLKILETAYNKDSKKVMVSVDNQGEGAAYYT
ncbi:MAG: cell wall-binding repeat-containing protein, partial [Candidatus Micrarchaeota archaeon]